jgi:hypothetical protein
VEDHRQLHSDEAILVFCGEGISTESTHHTHPDTQTQQHRKGGYKQTHTQAPSPHIFLFLFLFAFFSGDGGVTSRGFSGDEEGKESLSK